MTLVAYLAIMLATPSPEHIESVIARLKHEGFSRISIEIDVDRLASDPAKCVHYDWEVDADLKHWDSGAAKCAPKGKR